MQTKIAVRGLDISVTPLTAVQVADEIVRRAGSRMPMRIANFNLHAVYLYHTNSDFARFCDESDLLLIDGWPVWFLAKLSSRRVPGVECRIGSTDWLTHLLESREALVITAVGGTEESSRLAAQNVALRYPWVTWRDFDGFSSQESISPALAGAIADADLVLVGMGMPLQELWIERNDAYLQGKVVANVGGCIDYFAGTQKLAPRWTGRMGVEWLYRLVVSPRRLWKRYIVEPVQLHFVLMQVRGKRMRK